MPSFAWLVLILVNQKINLVKRIIIELHINLQIIIQLLTNFNSVVI